MEIENSYIFRKPDPGFQFAGQFPGNQYGGTIEQIRNLIQHQKKSKGFSLQSVVGTQTFNLVLSGDARLLLGYTFLGATAGDFCRIKINNEIINDNVPVQGLTLLNNAMQNEYYEFPRPLSGQDEIVVEYTSTVASLRQFSMYYL